MHSPKTIKSRSFEKFSCITVLVNVVQGRFRVIQVKREFKHFPASKNVAAMLHEATAIAIFLAILILANKRFTGQVLPAHPEYSQVEPYERSV